MERFKTLEYTHSHKYDKQKATFRLFVPGVNSGEYDKALCIDAKITKRHFFGFGSTSVFHRIVLSARQVEELRDECNKILALNK